MTGAEAGAFALAMVALAAAHMLRATRHALLFPHKDHPPRFDLLLGLALGYVINLIVPFRVGELARAMFITIKLKRRLSFVLATIATERLSDILVVVIGLLVASAVVGQGSTGELVHIAGLALTGIATVVFAVAVQRSRRFRRGVGHVAGIFNEQIAAAICDFAWSFARLVCDGVLWRPSYIIRTLAMWATYILSYVLFARAMGRSLLSVGFDLFGTPLRPFIDNSVGVAFALVVFTSAPVLVILLYGLVRERVQIAKSISFTAHFGLPPSGLSTPMLAEAFHDSGSYASVLRAQFTHAEQTMANFGRHGIGGAVIHRLLPGGSDALTALVEVDNRFAIRKFAIDGPADKLAIQADWLRLYEPQLPLAAITSDRREGTVYSYDMPYVPSARDFYEVIHTAPIGVSRDLLSAIFAHMADFHDRNRLEAADEAIVTRYLVEKVQGNARTILDFARLQLDESYQINGEAFSLSEWDRLLDPDWCRAQISRLDTGVIHGDLTIENMIICPDTPPGWYIIDPNPENLFQSDLIDWAKLMQSLNLGYEGMNRAASADLRDNALNVVFARSKAYAELHDHYLTLLADRFSPRDVREIAFHELVNYLRLTPYKIKRSPEKGLAFFAATSILLRRYLEGAQ
jgi:hypothetical protein